MGARPRVSGGPPSCWIGTYPPDGPAGAPDQGEGIWRVDLGGPTATLAVTCAAPSFLVSAGETLYAANETASGTVTRFAVTDSGLQAVEQVGSGGDDPCHLLRHPLGRALYVSNYSSGTLAVLTLDPGGTFTRQVRAAGGPVQVFQHTGSGPDPDRQSRAHAHSTHLRGGELLAADLGTDELLRYAVADDGRLTPVGIAHRFPPGTGPRHLASGPGGHLYAVGELDSTLHVLARQGESIREVQVQPACRSPLASGSQVYPAHVEVIGRRVLVSVRGPDVIAEFALHDGGARAEHVRDLPAGGAWPRHFAHFGGSADDGGWLVIAAQNSGRVVVNRGGVPVPTAVDIPFPACVVPAA